MFFFVIKILQLYCEYEILILHLSYQNVKIMKNDLNKPVRTYQGGDDYREVICFNYDKKTEEFENSTDLYVTDEIIDFDEDNLTDEQIEQVYNFAEEIQSEIRQCEFYYQDMKRTERSLMHN